MNKSTLYIFTHIPKTGGSSFNRLVEINTKKEERVKISADVSLYTKSADRKDNLTDKLEKKLAAISDSDREKIKFIYGHGTTFGMHKYFNKNYKYIVFFRDPKKRTLSLYNYYLNRYKKTKKTGGNTNRFDDNLLVKGEIPNFALWLKEKYGKSKTRTETMYQHLKGQGFINGSKDQDIRNMLKKFYFAGVVKDLDQDLNYLCGEFGFSKFLVRQNISRKYLKHITNKKALELLEEKNNIDEKIYDYAVEFRDKFIMENKNYYKIANTAKKKKKFLLPFTQVIFDPKGSVIDLSRFLKRKSKLYENIFDLVRGYKSLDDFKRN